VAVKDTAKVAAKAPAKVVKGNGKDTKIATTPSAPAPQLPVNAPVAKAKAPVAKAKAPAAKK
jgi:hypothetical protein